MSAQPVPAKVCRLCGQDCSSRPRVKDHQGFYYCQTCYDQAHLKAKAGEPVVAKPKRPVPPPAKSKADEPWDLLSELAETEKSGEALDAGPVCPECGADMPRGAVLCTACGFNKQIGKRLAVKIEQPGGIKPQKVVGKARSASPALGGTLGQPFVLGVAIAVVTLGLMLAGRGNESMAAVAFIVCGLTWVSVNIWTIVEGFREGVGHGIGCLLCNLYAAYFVFAVSESARLKWAYAACMLGVAVFYGLGIAGASGFMGGSDLDGLGYAGP